MDNPIMFSPSAPSASEKSRVLIVDDAPENIRILGEALKDLYTIMFALDGESALRLAHATPPPDIILLDVFMPGLDGYEVCRRLKADPTTRNIPVFFITAQNDAVEEALGLGLGAVDYISKPFRISLVISRIANQLDLKRHRDRLDDLVHERTAELLLTRKVTIESMAHLAEWRDPETGGHIRRTQSYIRILAEYMAKDSAYSQQLTPQFIEMLYLCAPLHDVGKVSIPDVILLKPGALTAEEFQEMKQHAVRGRDALAACERKLGTDNSFLRIAREIAYGHHERWNGKGYPQGVAGEDIPLSARLMSVADVYDALTSKRVYKPAMSHEVAMDIICKERGAQFDPTVVDALCAVEGRFKEVAEFLRD